MSGYCTNVTKGKVFKTQLFGQTKSHSNLINRHACVYRTKETHTSLRKLTLVLGVTVKCSLFSRGLIRLYIIEDIDTGQTYLQIELIYLYFPPSFHLTVVVSVL